MAFLVNNRLVLGYPDDDEEDNLRTHAKKSLENYQLSILLQNDEDNQLPEYFIDIIERNKIVKNKDDRTEYYFFDALHRENDLPAVEYHNGKKEWWKFGVKHRDNGPAVEFGEEIKEWWKYGKRHNLYGPAVIKRVSTLSSTSIQQEFWVNGIQQQDAPNFSGIIRMTLPERNTQAIAEREASEREIEHQREQNIIHPTIQTRPPQTHGFIIDLFSPITQLLPRIFSPTTTATPTAEIEIETETNWDANQYQNTVNPRLAVDRRTNEMDLVSHEIPEVGSFYQICSLSFNNRNIAEHVTDYMYSRVNSMCPYCRQRMHTQIFRQIPADTNV